MCSLFHLYRSRGWELFYEGKFEEAIAEWRVAADLDPKDGYILSSIGLALSKMGDQEAAITEWRQAVRLEPEYDRPHVRLACALSARGYSPEALAAVQAAIRLKADDVDLYNYLSYHLMAQAEGTGDKADWKKAVEPLRRSIALDPTDSYAALHLAGIQWFLGRKREAIATLRIAVNANPNNLKMLHQLGVYQARTGKFLGEFQTIRAIVRLPETEEKQQYLGGTNSQRALVLLIGAGIAAVFVRLWIWNRRRGR